LADDDPGLAHLLVARVEDQTGVVLIEPPLSKRPQAVVERLVDRADRLSREPVFAQRFGHRFDLRASKPPVHTSRPGCPPPPFPSVDNARTARSRTVQPILRHPQLQRADPRDQRAAVVLVFCCYERGHQPAQVEVKLSRL
jgi:hypothetical protein